MRDHRFKYGSYISLFPNRGTLPFNREKLKRSQRGNESGRGSSFSIRLFISSGPAALPRFNSLNIISTFSGVVAIKSRL